MLNTKIIYSLLEKLTFGKGLPKTVNGVRVQLPAKYIRYFPSDYESENFQFLNQSVAAGNVVLDIGAHIGLFSAIAAKLTFPEGKIFAFEPAPATQKVLHQTIRINQMESAITPVQAAMGGEVGTLTFFVSDDEADNSNSLVSYKNDRKLNGIDVPVDTIDHFVQAKQLARVDFIKIDVEGAEYDTLRGGITTLCQFRPKVILAIHPEPIQKKGDRLDVIYDLLKTLPYQITYNGNSISKEDFCKNEELIDLHLIPHFV
ncbi:MAG: 31-O-demethyl-FK506 methyltransferase FkbM [Bacteroidota bacterium]|jgi:FkbM family methyltransferase